MSRGVPRVQGGCCLGQPLCVRRLWGLSWVWLCLQDPLPLHRLSWERGWRMGRGHLGPRLAQHADSWPAVPCGGLAVPCRVLAASLASTHGCQGTLLSVTVVPRTLPHGPHCSNRREQPQQGSAIGVWPTDRGIRC